MSERLPAVQPDQVIRALERAGWVVKRQRGSHASLRKPGVPLVVTVPRHRGEVPKGTLRDILRDADISIEEFLTLL